MVRVMDILQVQCFDTALTPVQLCFPNEEQVVVAIVMVVVLVSVVVIVADTCGGDGCCDGHLW